MPPAPPKARRLRAALWALPAVAVLMGLMWALMPEPPRVEWLAIPEGWPNQQGSFKDSVLRQVPVWVWRVRDWVRGPRQGVLIQTRFATLEKWSEAETGLLGLGAPTFADTNGLQVWFIPSNQVEKVRSALFHEARATMLSAPRVQTADGVSAMVMSGATGGRGPNAFSAEAVGGFEPRVRGARLDLKMIFSCVLSPPPALPGSPQISPATRAVLPGISTPPNNASSILPPTPQLDPLGLSVQLREGEEMLVVQEKRAALGGRPFVILVKAAPMPKK